MIMDHNYKVDTVIHMYFRVHSGVENHVEREVPLGELLDMSQDELDAESISEIGDLINMERQEWMAEHIDSGWKLKG